MFQIHDGTLLAIGEIISPFILGRGYAGRGDGKNNMAAQRLHKIGPIPVGVYRMGIMVAEHPHLGKYVIPLEPIEGTEMHGRSGFWLHGDNPAHPGESSDGCPVVPLPARMTADKDKSRLFIVVP